MLYIINSEDFKDNYVTVIAENMETHKACVFADIEPTVPYITVNEIPVDMIQTSLPKRYGEHLTYEEYRRGKIFENNEWMSLEEVAEIDRILTGEVSINDES